MFLSWSAGMGSVRCCQDVKSRMARGDSQASELNSNKLHDSVQLNAHSHSQKNSSRLAEFRTTYTPTRRSNAPAKSWRLKQTERPSSRHCWAPSNTRHRVPLREPSQQFNDTEQKCPKRLRDLLRHGTVGSVCTHSPVLQSIDSGATGCSRTPALEALQSILNTPCCFLTFSDCVSRQHRSLRKASCHDQRLAIL